MNNPKVTLLSITPDIHRVIGGAWEIAKTNTDLDSIDWSAVDLNKVLSADLPIQEYINTIWCIEGMPRAFWDQLDRTRLAAFWEQSVRIIDLSVFAESRSGYWVPDSIQKNKNVSHLYDLCMKAIQQTYNTLIAAGIPSEDARGVIPLHVIVRGTVCINLRSLKHVIGHRICPIAQGGYWYPVILQMVEELSKHLSPEILRSMVSLPCSGKSVCPIESNVLPRLTKEDPNPICPVYLKKFSKNIEKDTELTYKKHPDYKEYSDRYFEFLRMLGKE